MFGASRTVGALALALAGSLALAAAAAAEYPSPPLLEVTTISHYEPEVPSEPGKTELDIQATFGWHVTVTVRAHGATVLSGGSSYRRSRRIQSRFRSPTHIVGAMVV
jgi:hypothetical protein